MNTIELRDVTPSNISPLALLIMLGGLGHKVARRGNGLIVSNREALDPLMVEAIKTHKDGLLALVTA